MGKKLCLSIYGELYMIDLEMVMYLQADDHYTIAYYTSGTHFMIPFGLSKVETAIAEKLDGDNFLIRLSRKYIVNIRCIFHINAIKQEIQLADASGCSHSLHFPKAVLRKLIDMLSTTFVRPKIQQL
jgi:DNA-binding LytR/AlgR family response regulator